ncbi:DUF1801 domain-containing protein [Agromyces sp. Soil535]|uniref:DUF1801 domain-containing protein n=1 Tax=Agromyces sp. Soil535 TaxID=1736390 RepID=UPI0006F3B28B|nr:DUF1801 domain-containing protein [Agromyces sp. Soil535]KRE23067.1 hypothetical protein ASG80_09450 [Agromyces sp. Soil535]
MAVDDDVRAFLDRVQHPVRRRDADTMLELMEQVTGQPARMWGTSIVGFGSYHYHYESGREGDAPAAGFSPRRGATTVYLADGVGPHPDLLERLGPHTTGVGCLYLKDLEQVDLGVLEALVRASYETLSAGTYGRRAREGGEGEA